MPWIIAALALTATPANAQDEPTLGSDSADEGSQLGPALRYRYMFAPRGIINTWYADTKDWTGEYAALERPGVSMHVIGLELDIDPRPANFQIYAEYWKVNMQPGYWDDRDSGTQDQTDGDWLDPSSLGVIGLGANFGHEFEVTDSANDVWLGFRLGGGLGLGIPVGRVDQWHPGANISTEPTNNCEPDSYAIERYDACPADSEVKIPPVLPILDLDLAWRLHFAQNGFVRLDAGLHDLFFFGLAGGATF